MSRRSMPAALTASASLALLLATTPPAVAAGRASRPVPPTPITACPVLELPVAGAGLRIQIDPVTGTLSMPTAIESAPSTSATLVPRESLPIVVLPNGTKMVRLDERFMEYSVLRLGADGVPVFDCVHGPDTAERRLLAPGPLPAPTPAVTPVAPAKTVLR